MKLVKKCIWLGYIILVDLTKYGGAILYFGVVENVTTKEKWTGTYGTTDYLTAVRAILDYVRSNMNTQTDVFILGKKSDLSKYVRKGG